MADLIGIVSILFVSLLTLILSFRLPAISKLIFVALILRVILILYGHYISPLPDSGADAITFERDAWKLAEGGFMKLMNSFTGPSPHFISWLIGIPYSLVGRSVLMAQSISLFFGIWSIYLAWLLAKEIWGDQIAIKVGWTIAVFPSVTLYSVLILREVYIVFFLLLALYGVASWIKTYSLKSIIISAIGFIGAIFFHGGLMVGALIFITIVGITILIKILVSLKNFKINFKFFIIIFFFILILQLYFSNQLSVPYLGTFEDSINTSNIQNRTGIATRGTASWPEWTTINSPIEILYKGPIRSLYLVFAPFPWDVNEIRHLIGMLDGFLYIYLSYLILCNIKVILNDRLLRIFLLLFISYIFVFGIGVGNFGTGIRHRSKFVIIMILLAAPYLKQFVFFKRVGNHKKNI
jgi:hypothetical protein